MTEKVLLDGLADLERQATENWEESRHIAPNSYGCGYDKGLLDALEKIRGILREGVLHTFHVQCPKPTAEQIIEWVERYPLFAEDIRSHGAVAQDWNP